MFHFSLVVVGVATIIGLFSLTGFANYAWDDVSRLIYVVLLFPAFMLLTVGLSKSFRPHTMMAIRAAAFIVMTYALIAFAL